MIFLVSNLCFYSRQYFEIFLLNSVQMTEVQLPYNSSHHSEPKIRQILKLCDSDEYDIVSNKILHTPSSAMHVVLTSFNLFHMSFLCLCYHFVDLQLDTSDICLLVTPHFGKMGVQKLFCTRHF